MVDHSSGHVEQVSPSDGYATKYHKQKMSENDQLNLDNINEYWAIKSWPQFRREIRIMKPRSKLYETIKRELELQGHWRKKLPRK